MGHINKATANNSSISAKMPKRRGKSAASKQQKTPKSQFEGAVLIRACCAGARATRPKEDGERIYHNKKKLERLLNAKIICKEDEDEDKEDQPRSKTGDERCRHNKEKPERALNDKEEQDDAEALIKRLDKWCKDNSNMNTVFSAYVL